jgi:hypothetical protein
MEVISNEPAILEIRSEIVELGILLEGSTDRGTIGSRISLAGNLPQNIVFFKLETTDI